MELAQEKVTCDTKRTSSQEARFRVEKTLPECLCGGFHVKMPQFRETVQVYNFIEVYAYRVKRHSS